MKKLVILSLYICLSLVVYAQETKPTETEKPSTINGKAVYLPKPDYPSAAKAVNASGNISVKVLIDEEGNVIEAKAENGHQLLREAAEKAAMLAKFTSTILSGNKVKVTGTITYNFVPQVGSNKDSFRFNFTWWNFGLHVGNNNFTELERDADWIKISYTDERNKLFDIISNADKEKLQEFGKLFSDKLTAGGISKWEFQAGMAIGKILENRKDEAVILSELSVIKKLAESPNILASKTRVEKLKELAVFANLKSLTDEQKLAIFDICFIIY